MRRALKSGLKHTARTLTGGTGAPGGAGEPALGGGGFLALLLGALLAHLHMQSKQAEPAPVGKCKPVLFYFI